ncbi:tyrosine-type recombinase/integrase [Micromonosporaceae bacterium Da 78-11]
MAKLEVRGNSIRVQWRLGGARTGAWQSCTFSGDDPELVAELADAAKTLVETRRHNMTRSEVYDAILGKPEDVAGPIVPTFRQWVDMYIADRERLRDIQPDVLKGYRVILMSRAVPFLGSLRLTDITPEVIRDWVAWLSSSRITIGSKNRRTGNRLISGTTVRRVHAIAHTCLSSAVPKWIAVNPAAKPAGASKHSSGLPRKSNFKGMFLKVDEVNLIIDKCKPSIRDLVIVKYRSGLRLGEIIPLRVRNVVFNNKGAATIMVKDGLKNDGTVGDPKSESGDRPVTMDATGSRILAERVRGKKLDDLVFPSPRGGMWDEHNFRDRHWWPAVAEAMRCSEHPPPAPPKPARGPVRKLRNDEVSTCPCPGRLHKRPRPHDLRHSHASTLIDLGWHARKIQGRLGHSSWTVTMQVYGHLMNTGSSEELESLDALLSTAVPTDAEVAATAAVLRREAVGSARRRVQHGVVRQLRVRRAA